MITKPHRPNEERVVREQIAPWLFVQKIEVTYEPELLDLVRPDFVTSKIVAEVKPEKHWAAGIGQLMLYAEYTGLEPTLFLLVDGDSTQSRHVYRAMSAARHAGVSVVVWNTSEGKPIHAPGWPSWIHAMRHGIQSHVRQPKPPKPS